jgi:hypothetical protein
MKKEREGLIEGVWNEFVHWNRLFIVAATRREPSPQRESNVHQVPLDNTLMAIADGFILFVLVLAVELELGAELDDVALALSCPEISEEKG